MVYESEVIAQHETGTAEQSPKTTKKPSYVLLVVIGVLLLTGGAIALVTRLGERRALAKETETLAVPSVLVIQPKPESPQEDLALPSTLQAYIESPIYARTNGYLRTVQGHSSRVQKGKTAGRTLRRRK
jgi:hypothetical protein